MQVVECFCGVCASDLFQNNGAARMGVDEVSQVIDFVIDDSPKVFFGVVLLTC